MVSVILVPNWNRNDDKACRLWCKALEIVFFLPTKDLLVYFVYMCVLPACMSMHHMCAVPSEAREDIRSPELELQMTVSFHIGDET